MHHPWTTSNSNLWISAKDLDEEKMMENMVVNIPFIKALSGWWFQPIWKNMLVKMDHFPK